MSKSVRAIAAAVLACVSHRAAAQTAAEYRTRVDSLARVWRPLAAQAAVVAKASQDTAHLAAVPHDSLQVGPIIVRTDSGYAELGRTVATRMAPQVEHAYGRFAGRLSAYQFVIRTRGGTAGSSSILTGIVDSTGSTLLRSAVETEADPLQSSWQQKVEEVLTDQLGPSFRHWLNTVIPMVPQDRAAWSRARVDLLLAGAAVARDCVTTGGIKCSQALGFEPVDDPAFRFYSQTQRRMLVVNSAQLLRRSYPREFDLCVDATKLASCDSLAHMIPPDVIPLPISPSVRQSLVRYALEIGGDGSFDRFAVDGTPSARIEAAARMPLDSVIARWHARLLDARSTSTAIDLTTAASSLFWVCLCAGLALRSSRWR